MPTPQRRCELPSVQERAATKVRGRGEDLPSRIEDLYEALVPSEQGTAHRRGEPGLGTDDQRGQSCGLRTQVEVDGPVQLGAKPHVDTEARERQKNDHHRHRECKRQPNPCRDATESPPRSPRHRRHPAITSVAHEPTMSNTTTIAAKVQRSSQLNVVISSAGMLIPDTV